MKNTHAFDEYVGMKFQIYNGLFLNLPFPDVKSSGILLPVFTTFVHRGLEEGRSPMELVEDFFLKRVEAKNFQELKDDLFRFLRLAERQVVLFDALEDAAFTKLVDIHGPGSVKDALNRIEASELQDRYLALLEQYRVRVVLTAHPTQFYTDQVLGILSDLIEGLNNNDINQINHLLLQMGKTRFKKTQKPTPLDEAQSLMWTLENVMFDVIPGIHAQLSEELCPDQDKALGFPGIVQLGFWPGGDRDGNPYVSAEITRKVGELLRSSILRLYIREMGKIGRRLTFDGVMDRIQRITEKLENTLNPIQRIMDKQRAFREQRGEKMVYYFEETEDRYHGPEQLIDDLMEVRDIIMQRHRGLFVELLNDMLYRVRCFGFHFATLDIRQDSDVHSELCDKLLDLFPDVFGTGSSYLSLSDPEKIDRLHEAEQKIGKLLVNQRNALYDRIIPRLTDEIDKDCIMSIKALAEIQIQNGEMGAHRYIISHTEALSHVLELRFLALVSGFDAEIMPIDIVPLFETIEDLHNAPGIMKSLYSHPAYVQHLKNRNMVQHIMLGFSDGTKDGGYVTANWEIYRAKEELTAVCAEQGIRAIFFDGRGGPPARGGGNTHKFYRSLGRDIDSRSIHLTLQGQTISSSYGTEDLAGHNLGQIVSAGLENNLFPEKAGSLGPQERELIEELSQLANESYMNLRNHPKFIPYLERLTPLKFYGRTNIGSRPSKRKAKLSLESLRAIPFVGAWSQMKQNVPGFFGLGTALDKMVADGKLELLHQLYQHSLFFRTLMENSMQSLSKAFFPLTAYLESDPEFGEFWSILSREAELTQKMLLAVSKQDQLLGGDPANRESIRLRERMILPVVVIQQYALQKIRQLTESEDGQKAQQESRFSEKDVSGQIEILEKLIVKSLMASINASRNSV